MIKEKEILYKRFQENNVFWNIKDDPRLMDDDVFVIENIIKYLDIEDINVMFKLYSYDEIFNVWKKNILPQEKYFNLNHLMAYFYFKIKNPKQYIKKAIKEKYERIK